MQMPCPEWVPEAARGRLEAVLLGQPAHAQDALDDLSALSAGWDAATRARLLERFLFHAERGIPLPAATILGVSALLGTDD
jgi:hypothetical protein